MSRESGIPGRERDWIRGAFVALSLSLFAVLGLGARRTEAFDIDVRFTRWLQGLDWRLLEWATDLTNWSMSGTPLSIGGIVIVLLLLWRGWRLDAMVLLIANALRVVNVVLKELIESPRPTPDLVERTIVSDSFGYPSGHVAGASLVVGALAWIASRRTHSRAVRTAILNVAGAWIALAGVARIYVGAHWPTDVIGAWLWSVPALILATVMVRRASARKLNRVTQAYR